jgi:hypothetical protein
LLVAARQSGYGAPSWPDGLSSYLSMIRKKTALGLDPRVEAGFPKSMPSGSTRGIMLIKMLEHVPQKWKPVLRKGHAQTNR